MIWISDVAAAITASDNLDWDAALKRAEREHCLRMLLTALGLADRVGSISVGKLADFTLLEEDPLRVDAKRIRDIGIVGTMLGGVWQAAV